MARGQITATVPTTSGTVVAAATTGDSTNGHYVVNSGKTRVFVKNTNGASTARTVTFAISQTVDGQTVTSKTKAIAAGVTQVFGPFDVNVYGTQLNIDVDNAELTIYAVE